PRTRSYPDPSRWEIAVNRNDVVVGEGHGNIAIPEGGYVLSGQGKGYFQLKNAIGFGQELQLQYAFNPEVQHAIGGGPLLLRDGQVQGVPAHQRFQGDILYGRAARSAVGMTHDGKFMLVTIDGRRPGYSVGATLSELAYTMKELGAVEALNLDGGGSTTMVVRNKVINRPSDGWERPVSTALLVLPRHDQQAAAPAEELLAFFQPMADEAWRPSPTPAPSAPLTGVGGVEKGSAATVPGRMHAWNAAAPHEVHPQPPSRGPEREFGAARRPPATPKLESGLKVT
ncbi:MAG: phosphodiester glycosidase family protein, partial [Candidatus Sericytochromatia bacterium]